MFNLIKSIYFIRHLFVKRQNLSKNIWLCTNKYWDEYILIEWINEAGNGGKGGKKEDRKQGRNRIKMKDGKEGKREGK